MRYEGCLAECSNHVTPIFRQKPIANGKVIQIRLVIGFFNLNYCVLNADFATQKAINAPQSVQKSVQFL